MGDIYISRNEDGELVHSAKGTTWQSKNAAYISRVKKNGKWVYTYASNKAGKAARAARGAAGAAAGAVAGAATGAANKAVGAYKSYNSTASKVNRSMARDRRANATKKAIAKGKAKVNELLERMRKTAKVTRAKVVNAKLNRDYQKKYVTNRERDVKRRKEANRKKYAAQAKAQRRSKNKIAREQAVGKAKKRIKEGLNPSSGIKGNYNAGTMKLSNGARVHFSDVEVSEPRKPRKSKKRKS